MNLWPLAVYLVIVGMLVVAMLGLSFVLGQRHHDRATGSPYESGILSRGFCARAVLGQVLSGRNVLRHLRS